ncbi:MAG: nucleoside monophosphate kinase [Candidatus Pacebacteria bacterium]|nr:nucleoside monophosphate kinase [Candidatus Paceibacterota bacterium]
MKSLNIILLGRSGSGKGTQAELLSKKFSLVNIDSGDILRELAKRKDQFGKNILETITQGKLVPLWLVIYCWLDKFLNLSPKQGIIMEGSPRLLEEAKILEEVLSWFGRKKLIVIYLETSEKEVTNRLLNRRICSQCHKEFSLILTPGLKKCSHCGGKLIRRPDDYPRAIKNRMLFFKKNIIPVINYFHKKNMLIKVKGEGSVMEIHQNIVNKINPPTGGKR